MTSLPRNMRQTSKKARRLAGGLCASMALISQALAGGGSLAKQGAQFAIAGALPGEQTGARLVLGSSSGLLVWQDNGIDGKGLGIAAAVVQGTTINNKTPQLINQTTDGDQDSPDAARLNNGSSLIVWRSSLGNTGEIWGRLVGANGTPVGSEFRISAPGSKDCLTPSVAVLADGSAVVAWAQRDSGNTMLDVYVQRVASTGSLLGTQTLANQYSEYHQRNPSVTGLKNGGFVVAWVSEDQTGVDTADIYARIYGADGDASADEFRLNANANICGQPVVQGLRNGGFMAAWSDQNLNGTQSLDVQTRVFDATGNAAQSVVTANSFTKGRQYRPRITETASGPLVVWTSFGQDGWDEGVFARRFDSTGAIDGDEIQVNTAWEGKQIEPAVASNGTDTALVVWSTYSYSATGFDLNAQVLGAAAGELPALPAPFAYSTSPTRINLSWTAPAGLNIAKYEVFLDGSATPELTANNYWASKALLPASTHSLRLGYQLADGRRGPSSTAVEISTWGEDANGDGLPDDWQTLYFGESQENWPSVSTDSDGDGVSDRNEFLAGTNPRNASSIFSAKVSLGNSGNQFAWATQPGFVYQVQRSADLKNWQDLGGARVAPSEQDSVPIEVTTTFGFYRVIRVR